MILKPILFENEYDYMDKGVFDDDDMVEYMENAKREKEQFWNNCLKKYGLKYTEVPAFYDKYNKRVDKYLQRIGCSSKHRITVSHALCDYLEKHSPDSEDYFFWQLCIHDSDHVLLDYEDRSELGIEKQDILRWFFRLLERMEGFEKTYVAQQLAARKYEQIMSNIVFKDESVGTIEMSKVKSTVLNFGISGECFEENLELLADRICHSESLFKVAPLVFYAALERYTRKMTDSQEYKMNFKNALRRIEYSIEQNNGKNIHKYYEHIRLFLDLCDALCPDEDNRFLCYAGFTAISNLCECSLINWEYSGNLRPIKYRLMDMTFDGFIHGTNDNPCYIESTVSFMDLLRYEEYDKTLPKSKKFLSKLRDYIFNHPEICKGYIKLMEKGRTEECIPIVTEVINRSGIDIEGFGIRMQALMQAIVMNEIMEHICVMTQHRLTGFLGKFDKIIFNKVKEEV